MKFENHNKLKVEEEQISEVHAKFEKNDKDFYKVIKAKAEEFPKGPSRVLAQLVGVFPDSSRLIACNRKLRRVLRSLCGDAFLTRLQRYKKDHVQLYFVTIIAREFVTHDRETTIQLKKMKAKFATTLNKFEGSYFGIVEVQGCVNVFKKTEDVNYGREICPHIHAIVETTKDFSTGHFAKELSKVYRHGENQIQAVDITEIGKTSLDLHYVAGYMTKLPYEMKSLYVKKGDLTRRNLRDASDENRREVLTLRLAEILSQLDLPDLIMASKDFKPIKNNIIKALKACHAVGRKNTSRDLSIPTIRKTWAKGKAETNTRHFKPVVIVRGSESKVKKDEGSKPPKPE